jgi:hypothetical protein
MVEEQNSTPIFPLGDEGRALTRPRFDEENWRQALEASKKQEEAIFDLFFKPDPPETDASYLTGRAYIQQAEERSAEVGQAIAERRQIRLDGILSRIFLRHLNPVPGNYNAIKDYLLAPFSNEKVMSKQRALNLYFDRHHDAYCYSLDEKISRKPNFVTKKTKVIVGVAAKNEPNLEEAVSKLKSDWESNREHSSFEEEVSVFVFGNSALGESLPQEMARALQHLDSFKNILVCAEEMDTMGTNAGIPKKITMDVALRVCQQQHVYPTLIGMDGDLKDFEPGTIQSCLDALRQPDILAVSPEYDYDPESQVKFPLWGLRCSLLKRLREYDLTLNQTRDPRLIGGLYCIEPKTLALLGGVPAIKNQDVAMTIHLRELFSLRWFRHEPIAQPQTKLATAYFNPSKELANILLKRSPESHWQSGEIQKSMSGEKRLSLDEVPHSENTLLAAEVTSSGIAEVLRSVWEYQHSLIDGEIIYNILLQLTSSRFLRSLLDLEVDLQGIRISTSEGRVLEGSAAVRQFLDEFDTSKEGEYGKTKEELMEEQWQANTTEGHWEVTGISAVI